MKNKMISARPQSFHIPADRRRFFKSMFAASAGFTLSGYLAEALTLSPIVTQGPYYPLADDIPLDKDNDLVQLNDNLTIAAGGGSLTMKGALVAGPAGGDPRYKISLPAYNGYTYEIYGNPTFADLAWSALPFSLSPTGTIDRNKYTAASDGTICLYVEARSAKGFYCVSFRVPGANSGTP